jgi:hypothetical protein
MRWPVRRARARRYVLREFPYELVYRYQPGDDVVRVIAIAHQHRRPGYWRRR